MYTIEVQFLLQRPWAGTKPTPNAPLVELVDTFGLSPNAYGVRVRVSRGVPLYIAGYHYRSVDGLITHIGRFDSYPCDQMPLSFNG